MSGAVAIVTGSSRGIGKAITLAFAADGIAVAVNAPAADEAEARATLKEVCEAGGRATLVLGDVAAIGEHEALLDEAEAELGPLTCLVNNAGVSVLSRGDLLDVTPESYDRCQAVNTRGGFFLSQAFARRLVARDRDPAVHHAIINVTSCNAHAASVNRGEYCVSKAAMSMGSRLYAVRLGAHDIGVYEIQPGIIETAMTAPAHDTYSHRIAEGLTVTPRMGLPEDVAAVALAMARGNLAYSSGQAVQVDGGLLIPRL